MMEERSKIWADKFPLVALPWQRRWAAARVDVWVTPHVVGLRTGWPTYSKLEMLVFSVDIQTFMRIIVLIKLFLLSYMHLVVV